ncbi:MAG: hypothetical protein GWP14_08010 [Actinobacteria bacterium]|nr:hypothetical protein [Actinomycetota bacterium]
MKIGPRKQTGGLSRLGLLLLIFSFTGLTGCQAVRFLVHLMVPVGKGEWVPAESEVLTPGKKVLILVYADQSIQYLNQQLARFDTAAAVAAELDSKLELDVVDPATVEHFQAANFNWADQPLSRIAQRYRADYILYIELLKFTTSAEQSGELVRGQLEATSSLYSADDVSTQLWQGKVKVVYPDTPLVADMGVSERIRYETLKLFAERLVKHFYGHYEPL